MGIHGNKAPNKTVVNACIDSKYLDKNATQTRAVSLPFENKTKPYIQLNKKKASKANNANESCIQLR